MTEKDKTGVFKLEQVKGDLDSILARIDGLMARGYAVNRNELRNIRKSLDLLDVHAVAKSVSEIVRMVIRNESVFVAYLGSLSPESSDLIALEMYVDTDSQFKASVLIYEVEGKKLTPYPNAVDIVFPKQSRENNSVVFAGLIGGMKLLLDVLEGKTNYYDSLKGTPDVHLN